jgi:hypothetical protein
MFQVITRSAVSLFTDFFHSGEAAGLSNLLEAERALSQFGKDLVREIGQQFVDLSVERAKAERPNCRCGKQIPIHSETVWMRHGAAGALRISDPYCYCKTCGASERPLHALLGTDREKWSLDLERMAVDLASDESCEKAVKKLERTHPGVEMGRTTALRLLHEHGEKARIFVREKLEGAVCKAQAGAAGGVAELEVEYDGGMIPTATLVPIPNGELQRTPVRNLPKRKKVCEWKETKVGLAQIPGEASRLYTARPTHELEQAFDDLLGLACLKGLGADTFVRGLADGAPYIRKRMEKTFEGYTFQFILDWPHAKQHVCAAAERVHPADTERRKVWVEQAMQELECGEAAKLVSRLRRLAEHREDDELRKAADYLDRNKDAVAYAEYRKRGWGIASSEVESGHRHVVQVRLKIPGAWWHPDNVGNILALRLLKSNEGWWDEYWQKQDELWRERAYGYQQAPRRTA